MSLRPVTKFIYNLSDEDLEDFSKHLQEIILESIPGDFRLFSRDQLALHIFKSVSKRLELDGS